MSTKYLNIDANAKTRKGAKRGYMTGILYLAPATNSGHNVCSHPSPGCLQACLYTAGRGRFDKCKNARINKTKALFENREAFVAQIKKDIEAGIRKAKRESKTFVIRLNGTSDLAFENFGIMQSFPEIQFYDYTKNPFRMTRFLSGGMPSNYHLTFSASECNEKETQNVLAKGGNVAMVFRTKDEKEFPASYWGYPVVSGDKDDLRFLDEKNVIVALKMKGKASKDLSGFVRDIPEAEILEAVA